jgi:hemoglobin
MSFFVPSSGPPAPFPKDLGIYEAMGEENIEKMLEDFYLELGVSKIAYLFPKDLVKASRKSAAFFVFLLGGPPLYHKRYGPPMMRKRHMAFAIDKEAKEEWMRCFKKIFENAEEKYLFPKQHKKAFLEFLDGFANWMINKQ